MAQVQAQVQDAIDELVASEAERWVQVVPGMPPDATRMYAALLDEVDGVRLISPERLRDIVTRLGSLITGVVRDAAGRR